MAVNASESGLLLHSLKDMPLGTKLSIAVLFPREFELTSFEVLAEVVWKENHGEENPQEYEFGLKFIRILEEDHRKLERLLAEEHST